MKKRQYRAEALQNVSQKKLAKSIKNKHIVFGVDIGKEDCFGTFMEKDQGSIKTIKWKSPQDVRQVVELLIHLPAQKIEIVLEPSGTYGDAFAHVLHDQGYSIYYVNPKRSHDAAEVYDGVPSHHDAKSAAIIAKLHLDGASNPWIPKSDKEREILAAVDWMDVQKSQMTQYIGYLESRLAKYWPEVTRLIALDSATLLSLLERFGSPNEVVTYEEAARQLMDRVGGNLLCKEKQDAIIQSAKQTIGIVMNVKEIEKMKKFAETMRDQRKKILDSEREVRKLANNDPIIASMGEIIGIVTASVIVAKLGDPEKYHNPTAYIKAAGLNLKERSSGKHKGKLKITKRGNGRVRKYLYFAVLRLIQTDKVFKAWYEKKTKKDGGKQKNKAIIALMRKLIKGLWHVSRGKKFDVEKSFDVRRLKVA